MPEGTLIKEEEVMNLPPNKVCLIVTGSQGQYNSALARLATNKNKSIRIKPGDKIMFSSDPVPGNEGEVFDLIEELILMGAQVVYSDMSENLHASGHGNQEDIKFLMSFVNPKYFIPIGGTVRHQRSYQNLVDQVGFKRDSVFLLKEGQTVTFEKNAAKLTDPVDTKTIYVDAYGVGDVGAAVLRDRQTIATDGMMVVMLVVDENGKPLQTPRFISRGFVFEKNEDQLFAQAGDKLQRFLMSQDGPMNINNLKREVGEKMEEFFFGKKGRNPLIVVDIIQM
jgi:ribonuclease J